MNKPERKKRDPESWRRKLTGQKLLLHYVFMSFGGVLAATSHIRKQLGDRKFKFNNLVNWRLRGGVPALRLKEVAKALGVTPLALNYRLASQLIDNPPAWSKVVKTCKALDALQINEILSQKRSGE